MNRAFLSPLGVGRLYTQRILRIRLRMSGSDLLLILAHPCSTVLLWGAMTRSKVLGQAMARPSVIMAHLQDLGRGDSNIFMTK